MKRFTVAGIFAMIGGGATLLLVASILYSCRQGGQPHDMGTDAGSSARPSHATVVDDAPAERPVAYAPSAQKLSLNRL